MTRSRTPGRRGATPPGPVQMGVADVAALREQGLLSRVAVLPPRPTAPLPPAPTAGHPLTEVPPPEPLPAPPPGPPLPLPLPLPPTTTPPPPTPDLDLDLDLDLDTTVLRPRRLELVLPDGQAVPVDQTGAIVGRRPRAGSPTGTQGVQATVTVADATRQLSRVHLRVWADASGAVWVDDLGSANGTALVRPDGEVPVEPGTPLRVTASDAVVVGDHRFTLRPRHAE